MIGELVGVRGFEPPTSCSQSKRATRLRYTPRDTDYAIRRATPPNHGIGPVTLRNGTRAAVSIVGRFACAASVAVWLAFPRKGLNMDTTRDIGIFVGSLRKESFNRKMAKALIGLAPTSLKMEIVEIGHLPFFNQDYESDPPQVVRDFKQRVEACDAVLFVT